MTTQKAQSKIKTSTIAITILSVLLAVAVASTIVLAAFSANKQASTTIQFASGITLNVNGISDTASDGWYTWKTVNATTSGTEVTEITNINGDSSIYLDQITATVTGMDAYIAVRAVITKTGNAVEAADAPAPSYTGATDTDSVSGWNVTSAAIKTDAVSPVVLVDFAEIFKKGTDKDNDFAGAKFVAKVQIVASDTIEGLNTECAKMASISA